ncbi:hypothetical protein [Luteibacter sp. 9133]|uniref:hypothetical protein n=1 Tax=Luteibacter sp. 9133 TaxID=1500891 RepID=UPI00068A7020|nr:hypothetical protein [Luteibacter sp. 9133]
MPHPIKLDALRDLVSSGAVKTATILGEKGGFTVHADAGSSERVLTNRAGQVKMFATTDTAVRELARAGLSSFLVDISQYQKGLLRAPRTDVSDRAKRASEALEHERWFRAKVDEALQQEEQGVATWHEHADVWEDVKKATAAMVAKRNLEPVVASSPKIAKTRGRKKGI